MRIRPRLSAPWDARKLAGLRRPVGEYSRSILDGAADIGTDIARFCAALSQGQAPIPWQARQAQQLYTGPQPIDSDEVARLECRDRLKVSALFARSGPVCDL